ncbi:MAG: class I SAM-dependent methyltransferase [Kiritimatiellaceae bacterium]|nr:class I SAM-dependent methyltransferase [Kiritimatiellaceae bacterium]
MGEKNFSRFQWLCSLGETPQKDVVSMVEWGSGGGANILRFSTEISTIYGVDISSPNLEECQRQVEAANFKGFHPVNISAETPEGCLEKIPHSLDFFLSTAVFQHFPGKQYGVKILKIAAELLRPEGLALIQIRYDNSNPKFAAKKRNYLGNAMTFTSYSIDEFWDVCKQSGFSPMAVQLNTDLNYAYYFLKKI